MRVNLTAYGKFGVALSILDHAAEYIERGERVAEAEEAKAQARDDLRELAGEPCACDQEELDRQCVPCDAADVLEEQFNEVVGRPVKLVIERTR